MAALGSIPPQLLPPPSSRPRCSAQAQCPPQVCRRCSRSSPTLGEAYRPPAHWGPGPSHWLTSSPALSENKWWMPHQKSQVGICCHFLRVKKRMLRRGEIAGPESTYPLSKLYSLSCSHPPASAGHPEPQIPSSKTNSDTISQGPVQFPFGSPWALCWQSLDPGLDHLQGHVRLKPHGP